VKKIKQRYWNTMIVSVFIGACILIGLKLAAEVVATNNTLRKEELALSREMVKQLAEIKMAILRMPAIRPEQGKGVPGSPCGHKQQGEQPSPCGGRQGVGQQKPCGANQAGAKPQIPAGLGSQKVEGVTAGATQVKGDAGAPVLIVEFSDFECPFSKRFYQETFPQIEKEYIATGKVKFAYRDFPLPFHNQALPAAIAARCADKSGKYWAIFDKFSNSETIDQNTISISAKESGLEKDNFERCFNDPAVKNEVSKDMDAADKLGVRSTPSFFINGRKIEGALPFEAFKQVIEEELKKVKK
jgi:protein-disulfide isomerase